MDLTLLALAKGYTDKQIEKAAMGDVQLDHTLTKEGFAADAKAVGQAIKNIELTPGPKGDSGVYVGASAPTDESVNVWINPNGEAIDIPSGGGEGGNNATFRHIATFVFDENTNVGHWRITQDADGNDLSLSHVFIRGDVKAADGRGDGEVRINGDVAIPWCFSMQTNGYTAIMDITMVGTTVLFRYMSWESSIKANRFEAFHGSGSSSVISSIHCGNAAGVRIPSGSKFEVWGY